MATCVPARDQACPATGRCSYEWKVRNAINFGLYTGLVAIANSGGVTVD